MSWTLHNAFRAWLALILAGVLPAWAETQPGQNPEAPVEEGISKDQVGFFGELISISADQLVLRQTTYRFAPDAKEGDQPVASLTDHVFLIDEGTTFAQSAEGLKPGAAVFVGARLANGVHVAIVVGDLAVMRPADPVALKEQLSGPIEKAIQNATIQPPQPSSGPPQPNCAMDSSFAPTHDMVNFKGCYGGPSYSVSTSITPTKILGKFDNGPLREAFSLSVTRFELQFGLAGWNYQLPFKFTAVDPSQVAVENWARECLSKYATVQYPNCPIPRPWSPGPTQTRNIEVSVTPVDPWPGAIVQGGLGLSLGMQFVAAYGSDCGISGTDPCNPQSFFVDFGPFSQTYRARGAPPIGKKPLVVEQVVCPAYGVSTMLQALGVPFILNNLLSWFDVVICNPFTLYNSSHPGFVAKVGPSPVFSGAANTYVTWGAVKDAWGAESPTITFGGDKVVLRYTPNASDPNPLIRFSNFKYKMDWQSEFQLKVQTLGGISIASPKWDTGLVAGMKFVDVGDPTVQLLDGGPPVPVPKGECDKLINEGLPWLGFANTQLLDAEGFSARQRLCMEVELKLAPEWGSVIVNEHYPFAVSPDGGTIVRVIGKGFRPGKDPEGNDYNGTGVSKVELVAADGRVLEVGRQVISDTELWLYMPAHPPTILTDDTGSITSLSALTVKIYGWGGVVTRSIYYAARPTIGGMTVLDSVGPIHWADVDETIELPVGSVRGGERVLIYGSHLGTVTDVFFGSKGAPFANCAPGSTTPLCAGISGGLVARVPFGEGDIADCLPGRTGTRCDLVRVRSACVGDDLANGRLSFGAYCGMGVSDPNVKYVRKQPPEITVTPQGGPPGTPVQVTINGTGFFGTPIVKIGATTLPAICNAPGSCSGASDTQLVVTVPASAVGTSQIRVINPCPAFHSSRCGESNFISFRHLDVPKATSLSPSQGTYAGGTVVTLTGEGLTTATTLTFAGVALPFTLDATTPDTKLTFTTPVGFPGLVSGLPAAVNVVVTVACGTVPTTNANACGSTAPLTYTYQPPAVRLAANLQVTQITGEVGRPAPVSATLTDFSTGAPLPSRTLSFSVLGVSIGSAVTNASGVAALTAVIPDLLTGAYAEQTVATFAGDPVYNGRTSVNWLILTKPEVVAWGNPLFAYYKDVPALLQGVAAVSAGGNHTMALKADGTVVTWGNPIYDITPPASLNTVTAISAGYSHSLALKGNGTVVKWGIGGGTLPSLPAIQRISAGSNLSVAVTTAGSLVAWAYSPTNPALSNVPTPGADPFIATAAGASHALALRQSGTVVAWGDNSLGQTTVPPGLTNVVAIAAAYNGSLALRSDGTVVGWGDPHSHLVCPPAPCTSVTDSQYKPPAGLTGVVAIGTSPDGWGLAVRSDKTVVAWSLGIYRNLNAPSGYAAGVESFSAGGDGGSAFYVALRKPRLGTTLTVDPVTGFAGDAVTLRAVLLTGTSGASDRDVSFSLNGAAAGTGPKTDGFGVTTKAATIPAVTPGLYPTGVQAVFATPPLGLDGSSASAQLLVRGNQTITFNPLADRAFDPTPFSVSAGTTSPLAVTFSASGACSVTDNLVSLTGPGTCTITASQPGDVVYTAATSVPRSFNVARATQTVTFDPLTAVSLGAPPVTATVSATSGLPVILTSLTPSVCLAVGTRVTSLTRGACLVAADQPGNANYFAASRVTRGFNITFDAFDLSRLPSQLDPPSAAVAAGVSHTCALAVSGGVRCWGDNSSGQLGDGSTTPRLTAVDVTGLGGSATMLAAGGSHTCVVLVGGSVKCWGANANGELGNNSTSAATSAVAVSGLSGVVGLAVGASHTCALTTAGRVKCWGLNVSGQLGNNSTAQSLIPVDVSGPGGAGSLSGVITIAAGSSHTCAVTTSGGVHCWGAGDEGELGAGSSSSSSTPVVVSGPGGTGVLSGAIAMSAGEAHTCAVSAGGGAYCWGRNSSGQLGTGDTTGSASPASVTGASAGVTGVIAAGNHTCLMTADDGVRCWGLNADGQVGDGTTAMRLAPVQASGLPFGMMKIAGGANHTCGLTTSGGVKCWGSNSNGQLGNNSMASQSTFVDVPGLSAGAASVGLGLSHTCAITAAGGVRCWGNNDIGQLGDGTVVSKPTPTDVSGLTRGVVALASGVSHTCALTETGGVKCWGWNSSGALGDGSNSNRTAPVDVVGLGSGVSRIVAGEFHTCALLATGGLKCWGSNNFGQLGDSTFTDRNAPVDLTSQVSGVVSLVAGNYFNCVLTSGGAAKCWGRNSRGQLGDGTTTTRSTPPVDVTGLGAGVLGIGAGSEHACAFLDTGVTQCWGSNTDGQLGDGSQTDRLTPVDLSVPLNGVSTLALGGNNTCAVAAFGAVTCWGQNVSGQLGDGTTVGRSEATAGVEGLDQGAAALGGASGRNCAVTGAGGLKCWGSNGQGQIDSSYTNRLESVDVRGGQSIYFAAPATLHRLEQLPLGAAVTSGLNATFESLTPSTCTVSGATLTGVAQGLCALRALQGGDVSHAAAPPQLRVIPVAGAQFTVTPSSGGNGTISPATGVPVIEGLTTQFTVTPDAGYTPVVGGTCGGSLSGTTYTTAAITANCTVAATFLPVSISISDVSVTEGTSESATAAFTVTLSRASVATVTVSAQAADGTAVTEFDYNPPQGPTTITFSPGVTSQTFSVQVAADHMDEFNETFVVNLSSATNASILDAQGVGTIVDDDDPPELAVHDDGSVTEGNTGTINSVSTVYLSEESGKTVTVSVSTSNGTATAGSDYVAAGPTTLTFAPGQRTATFTVLVKGDTLDEDDEYYFVNLASPTNATIPFASQAETINDNDAAPSLSIGDALVAEGNSGTVNASFTLTLSAASGRAVTVSAVTSDGTAAAGSDYTATGPTTVTIAAGQTTGTFTVPVKGDTLDEANETFTVTLSDETNATISDGSGLGTITDDDAAPTLSIDDVTVTEGNSGSVNAVFTVTLSAASGQAVTVLAATANGTATAGSDYTATGPTTITFNPGVTTRSFTVPVLGDAAYEQNETFVVNLTSPVNATVSDAQGTGTITDDDGEPNASATHARSIGVNSTTRTTVGGSAPGVWYRARLFANRSYQISAWPVDHEQGADAAALSIAVFSDDAGTAAAAGVSGVSSALEGTPNQGGDDRPFTVTVRPAATGVYKIRIQAVAAGATLRRVHLMLRETTLFSAWTSRAAGFEGFVEMHNNTSAPVSVTLRAFDSGGVLLGAGLTLTLQPNATEVRTATQVGVSAGGFAGIALTHDGASGAVSGNITTLNGANGLSFDSPFASRDPSLKAAPVR